MTDTKMTALTEEQKEILQFEYVLKDIFTTIFESCKKELTKDLPTTVFVNEHGEKEHNPISLPHDGKMLIPYVEGKASMNEDNTRAVLSKYIREEVEKLHESRERKEMLFAQKLEQEISACKKVGKGYNQTIIQPDDKYTVMVRELVADAILALGTASFEARKNLAEQIRNPKKKKESL